MNAMFKVIGALRARRESRGRLFDAALRRGSAVRRYIRRRTTARAAGEAGDLVLAAPRRAENPMPGDVYRFLVTGAETGGAYFAMEAIVPPGGGPPPHIHTPPRAGATA